MRPSRQWIFSKPCRTTWTRWSKLATARLASRSLHRQEAAGPQPTERRVQPIQVGIGHMGVADHLVPVHTRAVQETGRPGGADGPIVTSGRLDCYSTLLTFSALNFSVVSFNHIGRHSARRNAEQGTPPYFSMNHEIHNVANEVRGSCSSSHQFRPR